MRPLRPARVLLSALLCLPVGLPLQAQTSHPNAGSNTASAQIQALLARQVTDWNRGDLDAFATGYKNSPDILFIGRSVRRGYAGMLAGYKTGFPTREAMGTLSFLNLETQPLDDRFATTTGHFHLERTATVGGNLDGYFLLVLEKTSAGWKIVRDDTTDIPAPMARPASTVR